MKKSAAGWILAGVLGTGTAFAQDVKVNADIDAKLEAARAKLEAAEHEVAELSAQAGRPAIDPSIGIRGYGRQRTFVGVQLDPQILRPPLPPEHEGFDRDTPVIYRGPFDGDFADMDLVSLTPQLGRYFGTTEGILVVRKPEGDPLKLEDGDVILSIDGRKPTSGSHATRILRSYQPGEKLRIEVMRQKKPLNLDVTVSEGAVRPHDHELHTR